MSISKAWDSTEVDAAIGLYLIMRVLVERGEAFNKRAMIRDAQQHESDDGGPSYPGPLVARSRGSVEMKLMNITAVLHDIDRDDLSMAEHGYRPLNSYQAALRLRVIEMVDGYGLERINNTATRIARKRYAGTQFEAD